MPLGGALYCCSMPDCRQWRSGRRGPEPPLRFRPIRTFVGQPEGLMLRCDPQRPVSIGNTESGNLVVRSVVGAYTGTQFVGRFPQSSSSEFTRWSHLRIVCARGEYSTTRRHKIAENEPVDGRTSASLTLSPQLGMVQWCKSLGESGMAGRRCPIRRRVGLGSSEVAALCLCRSNKLGVSADSVQAQRATK